MPRFLQVTFRCTHCKERTRLRIMRTSTGSYLPVELEPKKINPSERSKKPCHSELVSESEELFNPEIHKSHLLNCPGLQEIWKDQVKQFKRMEYEEEKQVFKMFIR